MKKDKKKSKKFLIFFLLLLLVAGSGVYLYFAEREAPIISLKIKGRYVNPSSPIEVKVEDKKSGLSFVSLQLSQGDKKISLVEKKIQGKVSTWENKFSIKAESFVDGKLNLQVEARDHSWVNLFRGNKSSKTFGLVLDSRPPRIAMQSFRHNLSRGGAGLAGFLLNEKVIKAGIKVDNYFFPAYKQDNNLYLCFFSYPFNLQTNKHSLKVIAIDRAGNLQQSGFHYYLRNRNFSQVRMPISSEFLKEKMGQFQQRFSEAKGPVDIFLHVNRELREKNRDKLRELGRKTSEEPLWSGRFLRLSNAARQASFATKRVYVYQGRNIDQQTHLGIDLASIAQAEVEAANTGRVVYADWLGIYGQMVIIDHGLGLQTMYAHLSQINVQTGDKVKKGDTIGRTGQTGLAGGDHLHFSVLISGVPVNPEEWWDSRWIKHNIEPKLELKDKSFAKNQ